MVVSYLLSDKKEQVDGLVTQCSFLSLCDATVLVSNANALVAVSEKVRVLCAYSILMLCAYIIEM